MLMCVITYEFVLLSWSLYVNVYMSVSYPFITTLTRSSRACYVPVYVSNWSVWKLLVLDRKTWNHITVDKLFILIIVTSIYTYLPMMVIISYLKPSNCLQKRVTLALNNPTWVDMLLTQARKQAKSIFYKYCTICTYTIFLLLFFLNYMFKKNRQDPSLIDRYEQTEIDR